LVYLDGSASQGSAARTLSIILEDFTGANNGKYAEGTITTNKIKISLMTPPGGAA
jgi:hypothetical protein